jgi:type IV secretory pathway TraG/TraD family ATPase VirD4
MAQDITFIGQTTFRNEMKRFGIKTDDRRRHIYIVGKTGTGKTELLFNMAVQDIKRGYGMAFFDPHGETAERLLDFVSKKRINDVLYFNPADFDFPTAFNVFEKVPIERRHLVSSFLVGIFRRIWSDVWSSRIEYILGNCILALLEEPNSTILGIHRILTDPEYRKKVIEKLTDPMVKAFWLQEFPHYTQTQELDAVATIENKMGQIVYNPLIRNIFGQIKSKVSFQEILNQKKILIANLSRAKIGEDNSKILGSFLFLKLYLALLTRLGLPASQGEDFYLYLDEFQNFVSKAFASVLSEARKYKLNLILANQYLSQLEETTPSGKSREVSDAIFGNVGTIISFRLGAEDAQFIEREFSPEFTAQEFVNLTKYHIYLKLMVDGVVTRPFSAITFPPLETSKESFKEKIIKVVRERYATPRKIIEEKLSRWAGI